MWSTRPAFALCHHLKMKIERKSEFNFAYAFKKFPKKILEMVDYLITICFKNIL